MRWGSQSENEQTRTITKYDWYPIRIYNRWADKQIQWRWLERVKIEQEYNIHTDHHNIFTDIKNEFKIFILGGYWENKRFLEFNTDELREQRLKDLGIE